MKILLISIFLSMVISNSVLAERYYTNITSRPTSGLKSKDPSINCGIQFTQEKNTTKSPWIQLKNNRVTKVDQVGGPWDFISKTYGPCSFMIYNKNNFKGRKVNYGSGLEYLRVAVVATDSRGGGWRARSVIITPHIEPPCTIRLFGKNSYRIGGTFGLLKLKSSNSQDFYGPSRINDITAWSLVSKTSGKENCTYTLYNEKNFSGRRSVIKKINNNFRVGWRIRSIEISQ